MDEQSTVRAKAWSIYSSNARSPQPQTTTDIVNDKDGPWKSSMSAISFGFVATAILISMFLIMAIFEHFIFRADHESSSMNTESTQLQQKLGNQDIIQTSCTSDFSVVMPGNRYPTFIAQPAPLPCTREGVSWPYHHEHSLA